MKNFDIRRELVVLLLVILPSVFLYYSWYQIPNTIALHYGLDGKVDKWGSKDILISLIPSVSVILYLLLLFVPLIDPKKKIQTMGSKYFYVRLLIHFFNFAILLLFIFTSYSLQISFTTFVCPVLATFIILLGNFVQAIKPNYFLGIRTPWTLHDDVIWIKTHRFGGRWYMVCGSLLLVMWFVIGDLFIKYFLSILVFILLVPVFYSYIISKSKS